MPEVLEADSMNADPAVGERNTVQDILQALDSGAVLNATVVLSGAGRGRPGEELKTLQSIPALLYDGQALAALSLCHEVLRSDFCAQGDVRQKVLELRKALEVRLLVKGALTLSGCGGPFHLLPRRRVFIGRASNEANVDVAIDCPWLSRGDRNLALFCEGESWSIEDLGSTNGHFVGGERLQPAHAHALPIGETIVQVGREISGPPLFLRFRRPAKDPGAIVISFLSGSAGDALANAETDAPQRWIVFREQFGIGGADCALPLPGAPANIVAAIRYQSGFWILPSARATLQLDGTQFRSPLPLPPDSALSLDGVSFHVLRTESPDIEAARMLSGGIS